MAKDHDYGLKQGGLAAWQEFKSGQSTEFRRRFNSRPADYRMKVLNAWAKSSGWALNSKKAEPASNWRETENLLFENRYLLSLGAPFSDLVSLQDTYQPPQKPAPPPSDFDQAHWWKLQNPRLEKFDRPTLVKFERNPADHPELSVGLCPENTYCAVDAKVDPVSGEITRFRREGNMHYDCNPLSSNPFCQVKEGDQRPGHQWGAIAGINKYIQCVNDCKSMISDPNLLEYCKKTCLNRLKRNYEKNISPDALEYLQNLK